MYKAAPNNVKATILEGLISNENISLKDIQEGAWCNPFAMEKSKGGHCRNREWEETKGCPWSCNENESGNSGEFCGFLFEA